MKTYGFLYRIGLTPWERYRDAASISMAALFDREEEGRGRPPGRVLDLGCGRGQYAPEFVRRPWGSTWVWTTFPKRSTAPEGYEFPVQDSWSLTSLSSVWKTSEDSTSSSTSAASST